MLTPDVVHAVPLFVGLNDADVDRLVRTSADIRLNPGEYAVHEGGERALYAVLSGRLEVVEHFDGVERTLGTGACPARSSARCPWPSPRRSRGAVAREP